MTLQESKESHGFNRGSMSTANIARFENGSRVPTLVVLQKYASALGKRIKVELCDQEAK